MDGTNKNKMDEPTDRFFALCSFKASSHFGAARSFPSANTSVGPSDGLPEPHRRQCHCFLGHSFGSVWIGLRENFTGNLWYLANKFDFSIFFFCVRSSLENLHLVLNLRICRPPSLCRWWCLCSHCEDWSADRGRVNVMVQLWFSQKLCIEKETWWFFPRSIMNIFWI